MIFAPTPDVMVKAHEGRFAGKEGLDHMVYRASARDIDGDGFTDLLTLMEYYYWQGDVANAAFGAIVLRTRPGYQFDEELLLFWAPDNFDEPENRFDGAFGDFVVPRTLTDTPVLPPLAGTVLARDVDGDGHIDLVGAAAVWKMGQLLPGELAIARGDGVGGFTPMAAWTAPEGPTQTSSDLGPQLCYVHLVLLDLDASGYPALIYALPGSRTLVVHPQVGRTLGAEPLELPLDLAPAGIFADPQDDGTVDLLVSLDYDDHGTKDDESDDLGPFIDRYRVDP